MELDGLKKRVWGYSKDSVYRYIVSLEEDMSAKLEEKDREAARMEERLCAKIAELEKRLEESQEELRQLKETEKAKETEALTKEEELEKTLAERERDAIEAIRSYADEQREKAENYAANVGRLRQLFGRMLEDMDRRAAGLEADLEELGKDKPVFEPKLFRRKSEVWEIGE